MEQSVVFQGGMPEVKEVRALLERAGIASVVENPSCSTSS